MNDRNNTKVPIYFVRLKFFTRLEKNPQRQHYEEYHSCIPRCDCCKGDLTRFRWLNIGKKLRFKAKKTEIQHFNYTYDQLCSILFHNGSIIFLVLAFLVLLVNEIVLALEILRLLTLVKLISKIVQLRVYDLWGLRLDSSLSDLV